MAILSERLTRRFRNVPGVTSTDVADWISEAEAESGFTADDSVDDHNNELLYLAFSVGCRVIATDAARFFKYQDGDESVDKANIYENYLRLSLEAFRQYRYYRNGGTSTTLTPKRADGR